MDRADALAFVDGLGERIVATEPATGERLQVLRLHPALTAVPSFEFAVRERTARLMNFRHAYYARVRRVDRLQAPGSLALVSDHVEGTRLSDILAGAWARGLRLDINAALCLVRQLVPAVALLHENARDASHGLIAPERLVVTPHARLVIVEHVLGSAIEQLQFGRERLWQEFRVAVPASAGIARFDHRADVTGIGVTALAMVLGRPLGPEEFPHALPALLMQASERTALGEERPLSPPFRSWLARVLQLDVRRAFASAPEALTALEEMLATDPSSMPAPVALEVFLSQFAAASLRPPPGSPAPVLSMPVSPPALDQGQPAHAGPMSVPTAPGAGVPPDVSSGLTVLRTSPVPSAAASSPDPVHAALQGMPTIAELIPVDDLPLTASATHGAPAPSLPSVSPAQAAPGPAAPPTLWDDAATAGPPEHPGPARGEELPSRSRSPLRIAAIVGGVLALAGAAVVGVGLYNPAGSSPSELPGTLIVQSNPPGVEVFVDGVSRGMTPANISVPAGSHILELRGRGVPRVIPLNVPAGGQVSQYLEFADSPVTGMLVVHSQPPGASVMVDGVLRGRAPLTLEGLEPGDREVVLQTEKGSSKHIVKVLAGTTASLVAPVASEAVGPVSGWVALRAPFTIEIREGGQLLGTSETERVMLAAGRHELEFVNETLGFRQTRVVQVQPGKLTELPLELPRGVVHLNASPWAEVWIGGRRIGETPIGNLELPIGPHEVVFRHPQFGEQRHAISVTTAGPARLSVDMQ